MDKKKWIIKFNKAEKLDKFSAIIKHCTDKNVLDVGCVGQDKNIDNEAWLHGRIKKVARKLTGADIEQNGIDQLRKSGYEVFTPDELEAIDDKFDVIVMGDVIEHVSDPGQFLSFYSKFLNDDGEIIICTPNTFGIRYIIEIFFYGRSGTNEEHTMMFDPYVLLELFSRLKLEPKMFFWLKEYRKGSNLKQKFIIALSNILIFFRKYYNPNFMFIVSKK